jgi:hypothetical protein
MQENQELLTTAEAAALLRLQPQTLASWRSAGRYNLKYVRMGKKIFYRRADLIAWVSAREATQVS